MEIDKILEVVKDWVENETGIGFGYHINHCDDLTQYYDLLRTMLEEADKDKETIKGVAFNVDGSVVIETNKPWPNELKDKGGFDSGVEVEFEIDLD